MLLQFIANGLITGILYFLIVIGFLLAYTSIPSFYKFTNLFSLLYFGMNYLII